jgi:hypothetical protein
MSERVEPPGRIAFELVAEPRARIATLSGVIDDRLLSDAYRHLLAAPGFDPGLPDLVDLRAVTRLEVTSNGLRHLIADFQLAYRHTARRRVAIVAIDNATYGMARMYELLRGVDPPEVIQVFRDHAAAMAWLGRSESPEARSATGSGAPSG